MKLTFVEDRDNRQAVMFGENIENNGEYIRFRQFNSSTSEVDFFMNGPIKEVQQQIKKILEVYEEKDI